MKEYSYSLVLIGGILAFFGFGLPWNSDTSGANLANSGGDTLITIAFIAIFVLLISNIYIFKRHSNLNYFSIIITTIVSSIIYLMITTFLVAIFDIGPFSPLRGFFVLLPIYILVLVILGVIVYLIDQSLFKRYWRYGVGLFLGSVSLVFGFFLMIWIIDESYEFEINFIVISFIASVTIISVSTYRLIHQSIWKSWSTFFVLINCSVGLLCFLILFLGDSFDLTIDGQSLNKLTYGAFLSAVGYILSMVGVFCSYETATSHDSDISQQEEANLEGDS